MKTLRRIVSFRRWAAILAIAGSAPAWAAQVGMNQTAAGLDKAQIAALPEIERGPWRDYLARSEAQGKADRAALIAERAALKGPIPPPPAESEGHIGMPLKNDTAWYGSDEARRIADTIVSFQTPAGGWGKNVDRSGPPRLPGQSYVAGENWDYVGTIDNDATFAEMRFLALVARHVPGAAGDTFRDSIVKGVRYLLNAQYPNGGWPQIWPLQGGYHDAVTFNDDALVHAAETMRAVADDESGLYGFVPAELRAATKAAAAKALDCILAAQIVVNGKRTIWGQQHDPITLRPAPARRFEPALPSTAESADILLYLMSLPAPSPKTITAINAGIRWLKDAALYDREWTKTRELVARPGAGPIWARFADPETMKPRFGDRDLTIHDDVADLSAERLTGYAWYGTGPLKALKRYVAWAKERAP